MEDQDGDEDLDEDNSDDPEDDSDDPEDSDEVKELKVCRLWLLLHNEYLVDLLFL